MEERRPTVKEVLDKVRSKLPHENPETFDKIERNLANAGVREAWQLEFLELAHWQEAGASAGVYAAVQSVFVGNDGLLSRLEWAARRDCVNAAQREGELTAWEDIFVEIGFEESIKRMVAYYNNLGLITALYCAISLALIQTDRESFWNPDEVSCPPANTGAQIV